MEFAILGPLECREGDRVVPVGGVRQRALLAVLLLHANEVVSSDRLLEELWGDRPPRSGTTALQVRVSQLRKALGNGGENLVTRSPGYVLRVERDELDLSRFERLVADADDAEPSEASSVLREALGLWRGSPLADLAYEPFAQAPIARLEDQRLAALERRIDADLELGRHVDLVGELEQLAADHPLREGFRSRLMLALYRSGRQAEALETYAETRKVLVGDLGIEPSPGLQELERRILRQDPALDPPHDAPGVETRAGSASARPTPLPELPSEERKLVSVLVLAVERVATDVERPDPEELRAAVQPVLHIAKRETERHGGTFEAFIGDSMVGLFGVPVAHEDDPERAVRAALAIRDRIAEERSGVRIGVAVDTGTVLVTLDRRLRPDEPVVTGDVVATAQQLQAACPTGGIVVGEQTYRATRGTIRFRRPAGLRDQGTNAWEALEARAPLGADLGWTPTTPLIGRRRELDVLGSTLARACEDRSLQLVTLIGTPGIGKSRIVFEFMKELDEDPGLVTWRQGRCLPYGEGVTFWALGEAVKAEAGILESDSGDQADEKLLQAVAEAVPDTHERPWIVQHLRPLVGASTELGSDARSGEAFVAWRRFLEGLADRRPLILVLEDLHWADDGLLAFVDELTDRVRHAPLLVICTARPDFIERHPSWGGGRANALTFSLPPLSDEETRQIVVALLGESAVEEDVHSELLSRAAGNPFYAEQLARMYAELGTLEELPESVHGIIAARLDTLAPAEKALLQGAAVIGTVFWLGALGAVGERSDPQPESSLTSLEHKGFVQRAHASTVAGEAEYAFRHVLLRDVAYSQISHADRGDKHRRAAAWIESLGRVEDHAEMLADHFLKALEYATSDGKEDPALVRGARRALRVAGDRALALASYASAARSYAKALELWPDTDPDRVWVVISAGRASNAADGAAGFDLLEEGFAALRSRGDADGAAEVAVDIARCHWLAGDRDQAYSYVDRALELAEGRDTSKARAHALVARAVYHMLASEHAQAVRIAREALPLTEALGLDDVRVRALDVLGTSRVGLGQVDGLDDSRHAIALAREKNAFPQLLAAEVNMYGSHFFIGDLRSASEALRTLRSDGERYGTAMEVRWVHAAEAHQAFIHGDWDSALLLLDPLIAEGDAGVAHYLDPSCRALRACMKLARGDLDGAASDSEAALARARRVKDLQVFVPALALRATVLLAEGLREKASDLVSEMLAPGTQLLNTLLDMHSAVTPIELAWLLHDLDRDTELVAALESAPSIPWVEAVRAIVQGNFKTGVELADRIGAPSVEAYARLRAAETIARSGRHADAQHMVAPSLDFYESVRADGFASRAKAISLTSP